MEELKLNFSFPEAEFWIVFSSFSIISLGGIFIARWFVTVKTNVRIRIDVFICNSRIRYFRVELTIKYESKPFAAGLLNIIFLLTSYTTIVSMKSLPTLVATDFETYRFTASGCLHLMFVMLSVAETINGVNEASSSGKSFFFVVIADFIITFQIRWNDQFFHCYYLMCLMVLRQLCFPPI